MKILLIQTHMKDHFRVFPIGLAYIAAFLEKNGHNVRVYDPPPYEKFNISEVVKKYSPDVVGISCMTPSYTRACEIAKEIKSISGVPVIFGGIHPTSCPEETAKNPFVDYVVCGEGEQTILELVEAIKNKKDVGKIHGVVYKDGKKIIRNNPRELIEDIDSLPLPARHLFPRWYFKRYMCIRGMWLKGTSIVGSRGCPFNCSYCASKVMFGRRVRFRSPKSIVDEMEHLVKKYGIEGFAFSDDTFTVNKPRAMEILSEIKKREMNIVFVVQARADCIDDELAAALVEAGCVQVDVGVESGSEKILKVLQKGITCEQVKNAFKVFKRNGLRSCATFMLGTPTETMEDIEKTRVLAKEIGADYTQFFVTTPYPGTPLFIDICKKKDMKSVPYDYYRCGGDNLQSLISDTVKKEDIIIIQKNLNEEFLAGTGISMLGNLKFIGDTAALIIQRPNVLMGALVEMYKSGKITEFYRAIYYGHNLRH